MPGSGSVLARSLKVSFNLLAFFYPGQGMSAGTDGPERHTPGGVFVWIRRQIHRLPFAGQILELTFFYGLTDLLIKRMLVFLHNSQGIWKVDCT